MIWMKNIYFSYKNVLKCDIIIGNSLRNVNITPEMDSPYSKTHQKVVSFMVVLLLVLKL